MRILITGATGLIGRSLGRRLCERGHSLVVLTRRPVEARRELPFPAEIFAWDPEALVPSEALQDVEAIVHLAGESVAGGRWTDAKKARIRESRVHGTENLVHSLRANPSAARRLKVLVLGSAIGYYGDREDDENASEDSPPGTDFLARTCVDWERAGFALGDVEGYSEVRIAAIRTGIVLARQGGALQNLLPIFASGLGGKLGRGQQWMSWIHLSDIVELFTFALENQAMRGPVDGVSTHPTRNETFSAALAKAVGKGLLLPLPELLLKAALGEMATVLLGGVKLSAQKARHLGFEFRFADLPLALADLCGPEREGDRELVAEQWIGRPPAEVFDYFSRETNLEVLTPPFLGFTVVGKSTAQIEKGTLIDYKLKVHGIPLKWRTLIEEWQPDKMFVDSQQKGPYAKWRHVHQFESLGGGTLIRDCVRYRLPMGAVGALFAGPKVRSDVQTIFNYRRKKISEVFQ